MNSVVEISLSDGLDPNAMNKINTNFRNLVNALHRSSNADLDSVRNLDLLTASVKAIEESLLLIREDIDDLSITVENSVAILQGEIDDLYEQLDKLNTDNAKQFEEIDKRIKDLEDKQ